MGNKVEKAVLKIDSSNQCLVGVGERFRVNKMQVEDGQTVEIAIEGTFTDPMFRGIAECKVLNKEVKDKGCVVFKKIRRHGYARMKGCRRHFTVLRLENIRMEKHGT
jgi:ribosomal protein L21